MPIKFKCNSCQHVLTVPDNLAGKTGKCPKCQNALKVPVPKAAAAAAPAAPAFDPRMHSLLEEVGVVHKTGPICPSCQADIQQGVVVCINCGMNLQTGQKVLGYDAKVERPEFDNDHLNQAVTNMRRDEMIQVRRDRAAMPWWVTAAFLIGAIVLCGAGVILVDGNFGTPSPENTTMGKLQRLPVFVVLGATVGITGTALALFAHLSITIYGFQQKLSKGFLCLFIPLIYSLPYGFMNWTNNKAPVKGFVMAMIFVGIGVGLIMLGGGFGKFNGIF